MRIRKLEVKNFRCFESRSFIFSDTISAAIGINGTGKTALLEAIAVALGALLAQVQGAETARPLGIDDMRITRAGSCVPVRVRGTIEIGHTLGVVEVLFDGEKNDVRYTRALNEQLRQLRRRTPPTTLPLVRYFRAGRLWFGETPLNLDLRGTFGGYAGCLDPSDVTRSMLLGLASLTEARARILSELSACVSRIGTRQNMIYDADSRELWWSDKQGKKPLRALPDGVRNVVTMWADILVRRATLNEGASSAVPGIVLIDELDLHLHPVLQRLVTYVLRTHFPHIQFVVTTHSPFVLKELDPREIINLSGQGASGGSSIEDIAEEVMGVPLPQRSERQRVLADAAAKYFAALDRAASDLELQRLERKLNKALLPFADAPAMLALLRAQSTMTSRR